MPVQSRGRQGPSMRPFFATATLVALPMLQALLLPIMAGDIGPADRFDRISNSTWHALAIFVVIVGAMGFWTFAGARSFAALERGKRMIYAGTLASTLPLWAFLNGILGRELTDMIPLWLVPIAILISGAAISKDWRDLVRTLVIGFGIPVASVLFLATFATGRS